MYCLIFADGSDDEDGENDDNADAGSNNADDDAEDGSEGEDESNSSSGEDVEEDIASEQSDNSDDANGANTEKCAICLKHLRNQKIGTPESCDHSFCLDCITEWSKVRDMHADEPVFDNNVVLYNLP